MVEAEEVEQRRLQVVDVHRVSDRGPAEFVGLAVDVAFADSAAGHEDRKRVRVMVGPVEIVWPFLYSPRGVRPNSLATTTSVSSSRPRCFRSWIRAAMGWSQSRALNGSDVEPLVVVPRPLDEMHESDTALDQSAGQKAIGGKGAVLIRTAGTLGLDDRVFAVDSVRIERSPRLARKIGQFGRGGLHPERKLVAGDAAEDLRVFKVAGNGLH